MPWTRFLIAVFVSNILGMSLGNLFHWELKWLVWIYPLSLILLHFILKQFRFRKAKFEMGKLAVGWVFLFVALLAVPRLTYVLEWVEGYSAIPHADDWARLGEMVSLTLSERFPLLHPANQNFTFSFYYAAFIPWAVLKLAIPILTLKDVIFLGNAGYQILILMSLLEVGCRWLPSRRSLFGLLFLCTFFGGLEWPFFPWIHAFIGLTEDWHQGFFNGNAQISSFHTGFFWVIHHMASFYSMVLALVVLKDSTARWRPVKGIFVGLLLIHAIYASVFVFVAGIPFLWIERKILFRRLVSIRVLPFLLVAFLPSLFIYTNRSYSVAWIPATFRVVLTDVFWVDKLFSAPLYFVLVPLVEFAAIPLYLLVSSKAMLEKEKKYLLGAWVFMGVIYIVAASDANNFAMRGMILPSFVFFVIFCRYERPLFLFAPMKKIHRIVRPLVLVALSMGTLLNTHYLLFASLRVYIKNPHYRDIAREPNQKYYLPLNRREILIKYAAEKMILDMPVSMMPRGDKQWLGYRIP